jgi:hypothetical protein
MGGISEPEGGSPGTCDLERLDTVRAHSARVYDYWLGGKDNFAADRAAGDEAIEAFPNVISSVRANRAFLARTVRYLAGEQGIRQFLDIGTGIPASGNTHEVAQSVAPEARVVYVDNDPMVMAHARARLASGPCGATGHIDADLRDTRKIIDSAASTIDFTKPVAVMLIAVLNLIPDEDSPRQVVGQLMAAVPPGSSLSISHTPNDMHACAMSELSDRLRGLLAQPSTHRSRAEVTDFFDGLEFVEPGVTPVQHWRPATPGDAATVAAMWGGVAFKP